MKKLVFGSLFLALVGIGFSGCKKEEVSELLNEDSVGGLKSANVTVTNDNGVLYFRTWDDVFRTMDALSEEVTVHVNAFHSQFPDLDEDKLYEKEVELGWDEYQPFIDFENRYNFSSFRRKVTDITNDENISESDYNYWFDYPVMFDMRPMLNEDAIIGVSDTVFKFLSNGVVCAAQKANLSKVKSVNEHNFESYLGDKELIFSGDVIGKEKSKNCYSHTWWNMQKEYNHAGRNRRIRGRLYIINAADFRIRAETITQYHRGIWRFWRTSISAHTTGAYRKDHCGGTIKPAGSNNSKPNGSSVSTNRIIGDPFRVLSGELGSIHVAPPYNIGTSPVYIEVP